MSIKDGFVRTDTDGLVYKREDTYWAVHPSFGGDFGAGDPGVLDFKAEAIPVPMEKYWEGAEADPMENGYSDKTSTGFFYPHMGLE